MKPLILVVEHRTCHCGEIFVAPNPRPLFNHELITRREANRIGANLREILIVHTRIEYCTKCFKTIDGMQSELFQQDELPAFTPTTYTKKSKSQKLPPMNKYHLGYF